MGKRLKTQDIQYSLNIISRGDLSESDQNSYLKTLYCERLVEPLFPKVSKSQMQFVFGRKF